VQEHWELSKHQFPGVDPEVGSFHLDRFEQAPLPRFTYRVAGGELEVMLALVRGENAIVLRYAWRGPSPVQLVLRPLLALREFHHLQRENGGMEQRVELRAGEVRVQPRRDLPRLCFRYDEGTFVGSPDWWRRFEYLRERARGLDFQEDLWTPGAFEVHLDKTPFYLTIGVHKLPDGDPEPLLAAAREALVLDDPGPAHPPLYRKLSIAAGAFRADLAPQPGIIAGYPWFEVWGRDTLISLPGLYLVPGKLDGAMQIMRSMIATMQSGLIPNRIPDAGRIPEYHSADATLWLFETARLFTERLGLAHPFVTAELLPALKTAFEAAEAGLWGHTRITSDGLVAAGRDNDSLTWMDARVNGIAVTPRVGCPVELSALWAKGCETLSLLASAAGNESLAGRARSASERARTAFQKRFWCETTSYPFDVISETPEGPGAFRDASIRPNAIIALAVDPDCFTPERARLALACARRELVTPAGLRTLAHSHSAYVRHYRGGPVERDYAYHQGCAWPWLLGFYVRAARVHGGNSKPVDPELLALVVSAANNEIAVGQVPEIADGDPPHQPNGCVAQAWSVAELFRAVAWDLA
jgi:predicted glycogen debranching enzyme